MGIKTKRRVFHSLDFAFCNAKLWRVDEIVAELMNMTGAVIFSSCGEGS